MEIDFSDGSGEDAQDAQDFGVNLFVGGWVSWVSG
jgi:hypothetical protein